MRLTLRWEDIAFRLVLTVIGSVLLNVGTLFSQV